VKQPAFEFVIKELSVSGFQYGHKFSQWNSYCIPNYLFLYYNASYLSFNLSVAFTFLKKAMLFLQQASSRGARFLFAEGHHFPVVKTFGGALLRDKFIHGFLSHNWLGGTLTNWFNLVEETVRRIKKGGRIKNFKIFRYVSGISRLGFLPNVLFLFSLTTAPVALLESNRLAIPTVAVVDSDAYSPNVTFPVFGNDNSANSLYYLFFLIAASRVSGRFKRFHFFNRLVAKKLKILLKKTFISLLRSSLRELVFNLRKLVKICRRRNRNIRKVLMGKRIIKNQQRRLVSLYAKLKKLNIKLPFGLRRYYKTLMRVSGLTKLKRYNIFKRVLILRRKKRSGVLSLIVNGYINGSKKALSSVIALSSKMRYYASLKNTKQQRFYNRRR
jgi:small subunit ribosomal protein S2